MLLIDGLPGVTAKSFLLSLFMTQRVARTGVWRRSFQQVQRLMLGDANLQMPASSHLISHVMLSSCSIVIGQPDHHLQALASFSIRVSCARPRTMACFPLSLEVFVFLSCHCLGP
jgi:hypothetical protein